MLVSILVPARIADLRACVPIKAFLLKITVLALEETTEVLLGTRSASSSRENAFKLLVNGRARRSESAGSVKYE